ncbi:hypothetical protein FBUS_06616 [Fasciolopsis buskii]|uniref:Uncharacterized protein n=1 Tax=Fasciolopsis buskii TaxID=27845 RepID=A0A8E0RQF9_9TREM|nr:hypothetical protein FBUS_06616 [Fasciolopsis buski]
MQVRKPSHVGFDYGIARSCTVSWNRCDGYKQCWNEWHFHFPIFAPRTVGQSVAKASGRKYAFAESTNRLSGKE